MLAHVLAAAFCPNMAQYRTGTAHFDAVLGWVTLCITASPADAANQSKTGGQQSPSGHSSLCAALCAAVTTTVAAFAALIVAVLIVPSVAAVFFIFAAPTAAPHVLFGGIGSRAPPALV